MSRSTLTLENDAGFRALFEFATIGIMVADEEGKIVMANPATEDLFGYKSAELIGDTVEKLIPDRFKPTHHQHREGYMRKPVARPMGIGMELFGQKKDGTEFPVEISLGSYNIGDSKVAVAFVSDITQREESKQREKEYMENLEKMVRERTEHLANSLERERRLNELKSTFVSLASHEFRTPLSTILSSAGLAEKYIEREDLDNTFKHLKRIKSSVNNLTNLLSDFLSIDRLEQGKITHEPEDIDLKDLVMETSEHLENYLKPGQKIVYNHNGEDHVYADQRLLRNILINLLSNASKYSDEYKQIEVNTKVGKNDTVLEIRDHGIGIPEEDHEKLFGLFFRAGNVGEIKGTGLGLNIVSKYVDLMNGEISFASEQGKGTTFSVKFPTNQTD